MNYDCVIIDNPPTMGDNTRCAIACTDFFILPVQLKQFAINGLVELMQALTIEYGIERSRILILRNMFKPTVKSRVRASESLAICYPENVLDAVISEDEVFEKMVCENKSMFFSKSTSRAALSFQQLICEIFALKQEKVLAIFEEKLKEYRRSVSLENVQKAKIINLSVKDKEVVENDEP
jgi:cellulose biosynthesis protein BcsQ